MGYIFNQTGMSQESLEAPMQKAHQTLVATCNIPQMQGCTLEPQCGRMVEQNPQRCFIFGCGSWSWSQQALQKKDEKQNTSRGSASAQGLHHWSGSFWKTKVTIPVRNNCRRHVEQYGLGLSAESAVLETLRHFVQWRSTCWWSNTKVLGMMVDPNHHTRGQPERRWHNRGCVWDALASEWRGDED